MVNIIDLTALRPIKNITEFEIAVKNMLAMNFQDSSLFNVIEERRLYTPQTVEYIWEQNKGLKPHVVEVYYDNEYLCDITSEMQPDKALALVQFTLINKLKKLKRKQHGK